MKASDTQNIVTIYHIIQTMNPKQTIQGDKQSNGTKEANIQALLRYNNATINTKDTPPLAIQTSQKRIGWNKSRKT